jgi:hypothetical protein
MVILGDILAVLTAIVGFVFSAWAVTMGFIVLFPLKAKRSQEILEVSPWKSVMLGLVLWLTVGTLGFTLAASPIGLLKIAGLIVLTGVLAITVVGVSGLTTMVGQRIRSMDEKLSEYQAVSRGTLIAVVAGLLPLVGWFVLIPIVLAAGMGAGTRAVFARKAAAADLGFQV